MDTSGTEDSVLIREVPSFQGLNYVRTAFGEKKRCPFLPWHLNIKQSLELVAIVFWCCCYQVYSKRSSARVFTIRVCLWGYCQHGCIAIYSL